MTSTRGTFSIFVWALGEIKWNGPYREESCANVLFCNRHRVTLKKRYGLLLTQQPGTITAR